MTDTTTSLRFELHAARMLQSHPVPSKQDRVLLIACVQSALDCWQTCVSCGDACLGEQNVAPLIRCIRLNQDCATLCEATVRVLSRQTAFEPMIAGALLQACIAACRGCAEECGRHAARLEHCRLCAEACRACESACTALTIASNAARS